MEGSSETNLIATEKQSFETASLSAIYAVGTHYDIGYAVGQRFRCELEENYTKATSLLDILLPFYQTEHGRQIYEEYLAITIKFYPQYVREMQGIADGSHRPFHEVFLIHLEPEITTMSRKMNGALSKGSQCTTLLLNHIDTNGRQQTILAHNEDVVTGMSRSSPYIVHARIFPREESPTPAEEWSAYCYPGHMAGNCFSFNASGLATTTNRLFPVNIQRGKIPYYIAARALLTAKSIDDAEAMVIRNMDHVALGMSVSLAFAPVGDSDQILANIEIAPTDENASYGKKNYHIKRIPVATRKEDGFYYHCNRYERIPGVSEWEGEVSSDHRKIRLQEFPAPSNITEVLAIIGDTKDEHYPIYRSGENPDYLFTNATGVFDMVDSTFSIYTDNPFNQSLGPVMKIPLPKKIAR